ncbi:MAG: zinc ABC transporter substrate-binding protein [Bacteroidetes bacterium]|nr:MAG: zinc ABC transporter substrate-binding protein [Bacteroidota bacterium]
MKHPKLTGCMLLGLCAFTFNSAIAQDKLQVVTTLPDLAYLASEIGGDAVETFSIATGYQNPHFVDPKPSYILKLTRADMFITVGLDLEIGWVPALLTSARNAKIQPGGDGYLDASLDVPLLEVPSSVSREEGDIHVFGNPHYWLDPDRVQIMARNITNALTRLLPANKSRFEENLEQFSTRLDLKFIEWKERMAPYKGAHIIAYHNQWPYFEEAFGLDIADFLEPKPGIPPTPSQLALIIRHMQQDNLKVLIIAPYFKHDAANLVVSRVNGVVVPLASSVGAYEGIDTIFDLFEYDIELMINAFSSSTDSP